MRLFLFILLVCTLSFSCDLEPFDDDSITGGNLSANFEIEEISNKGFAPAIVKFKNLSTNAESYQWDFGDPSTTTSNSSTEMNPIHIYQNPGNYTINLTVKGNNGQSESFSFDIVILFVVLCDLESIPTDGGGNRSFTGMPEAVISVNTNLVGIYHHKMNLTY